MYCNLSMLVDLWKQWPGTLFDEAHLHNHFAGKRLRGEWFDLAPDDIAYIRQYFEGEHG